MRKMFSENQIKNMSGVKPEEVIDIVNEGIESGEIEAGGLTPEQETKVNNSLQKPSIAPSAQELVGISTSGEQNALTVGDGLIIENGTITLGTSILNLDFNNTESAEISQEEYNKINNFNYDIISCKNVSNSSFVSNFILFIDATAKNSSEKGYYNLGATNVDKGASSRFIHQKRIKAATYTQSGKYYMILNQSSPTQTPYINRFVKLSGASGTLDTDSNMVYEGQYSTFSGYVHYIYVPQDVNRNCWIEWKTVSSEYAIGFAANYDSDGTLVANYRIYLNRQTRAWTATTIN